MKMGILNKNNGRDISDGFMQRYTTEYMKVWAMLILDGLFLKEKERCSLEPTFTTARIRLK